jgi:signal transduction histidine kinase
LVPAAGVRLRAHPQRSQHKQFLAEAALPLAAAQSLLELVDLPGLPAATQLALRAATNHVDWVLELIADYAELGRLESDQVRPEVQLVPPLAWLEHAVAGRVVAAESCGIRITSQWRSFVPSRLAFDAALAQQALDAVLRVAVQRALPGPLELRLAYESSSREGRPLLIAEVGTRGGGFQEVEQGYVFTPFAVRDAASRPVLGLSIAHRLCELLGGELRVESPGRSVCSYRATFHAPAADDAVWLDPLAPTAAPLGFVCPGRVVFLGHAADARHGVGAVLRRAGYEVHHSEPGPALAALLASPGRPWRAVIVDHRDAATLVGALPPTGSSGVCIVVQRYLQQPLPLGAHGLPAPLDGHALLDVLRQGPHAARVAPPAPAVDG